jgi:WD40 repeat protein
LSFTPDGKTLASADSRGTLKLWEVASGRERSTIRNANSTFFLQSMAVTADGDTLLATMMGQGGGPVLKLWQIATGKEQATFPSGDGGVTALSADAKTVAWSPVERQDRQLTIEVWNLQALCASLSEKPPATKARPR